jgi:alpha-1,6-mannosyltransferase
MASQDNGPTSPVAPRPLRTLLACGAALVALVAYVHLLPDDPNVRIPAWIALFIVASLVWLVSIRVCRSASDPRRTIAAVFIVALAARAVVFPISPEPSEDAYRYLFDGSISATGHNPYTTPPGGTHIPGVSEYVVHTDSPTVYPPVAIAVFTLTVLTFGPSLLGWKIVLLVFEVVSWLATLVVLRKRGAPVSLLVVVAWCPLAVFELGWAAHVDGLVLPFLVGAVLMSWSRRWAVAGAFVALATMVRPLPIVVLPLIAAAAGRRWWRPVISFAVVVAIAHLPFTGTPRPFEALARYAATWEFNGALFPLLRPIIGDETTRVLLAALGLSAVATATFRRWPVASGGLALALVAFVCNPTLYPWYLIGALPLLMTTLVEERTLGRWEKVAVAAFLALATTVFLSYAVRVDYETIGVWHEQPWVRIVEYGSMIAAAVIAYAVSRTGTKTSGTAKNW